MNPDQSLTIVIPAYNEETRIGRTLEAYLNHFHHTKFARAEIIVVLNGCRDNTAGVVEQFASKHANLRVINEPRAVGKGGAIILGFRQAKGALVGYVDADNSTGPEAFQQLVDALDDGDVVIGSRWMPGSVVSPRQPLKRRIASRVFNFLVRMLFAVNVTDTQCGAKVFRAEAIRFVLPNLGITRWAFDVDVLFQCRRHGFRIREVPTVWSDSSGSQLRVAHASWEMLLAITRLRLIYSPFRFVIAIYDGTLGKFIHLGSGRA
jgi:glycosyltransferase involved in cell wall biosynthesis